MLGVDLKPVTVHLATHIHTVQGDLFAFKSTKEHQQAFDVFLSDMAPATTGDRAGDAEASVELCEHALQLARQLLRPPGVLLMVGRMSDDKLSISYNVWSVQC